MVLFIGLTEAMDKEERKENIQSNMAIPELTKNTVNLSSVENLPSKPTHPVITFQAPRAVHCVTTSPEPSVEDSPVKSLRKWVDGCFHNTPGNLVNISPIPCETPPSTPPQRSSTEASVIISGKVKAHRFIFYIPFQRQVFSDKLRGTNLSLCIKP